MSNAMRSGKRLLAGLASGALVLTGVAIAAAPSASAAPTIMAICAGNGTGVNGSPGVLPDPTSVEPDCSVLAALTATTTFQETPFGVAAAYEWYQFTVSGDSTFDDTIAAMDPTTIVSGDGKTVTVQDALIDADNVLLSVPTAGVRTVTVLASTQGGGAAVPPAANTFVNVGEFTVTGIGSAVSAVTSQAYTAVSQFNLAAAPAAPLAIVHVVDANGIPISLAGSTITNLTYNVNSGTIATALYAANDCAADGTLAAGVDPGNTRGVELVTPACDVTVAAGIRGVANSGLWLTWDGLAAAPATPGNYTASFTVTTAGGQSFPITVNYTVSSTVAAAWEIEFNAAEYRKGAPAEVSVCAVDLGGRIVPDGLGWANAGGGGGAVLRDLAGLTTNTPITDPNTGAPLLIDDSLLPTALSVNTYAGCVTGEFITPPVDVTLTMTATSDEGAAQLGWATVIQDTTVTTSARIGDPQPVVATIMIVGERGKGDESNLVFVEGNTTELVGQAVTPFFRFPGQTGMTAGTGVRTVDAEGNFNWQRKTGKRIAVQFRAGDVKSNTVIIEAR